jgi:uncharacterized repeat protein (TIGR03803 family)
MRLTSPDSPEEELPMRTSHVAFASVSVLAAFAVFSVSIGSGFAAGVNEAVIYSFQGGADGGAPYAGLTVDKAGNLYGTTAGVNNQPDNVFELSPPAKLGGNWTETVLYTFGANGNTDGFEPIGGVIFDSAGNLYGTTKFGGTGGPNCQFGGSGCGTVFELSPPSDGGTAWTETTLYSFQNGTDGELPETGLILDAKGNLFGTTYLGGNQSCACGTVFELSPRAGEGGAWTETTLYRFNGYLYGQDGQGPTGLAFAPNGDLWGTAGGGGTLNCGTIFRLVPTTSGKWEYKTMYDFVPQAGIGPNGLISYQGSFFGTTYTGSDNGAGGGTVFELSFKAGKWRETNLFIFKFGPEEGNPLGNLTVDTAGNLYGTTSGFDDAGKFGTVFRLAPPAVKGGAWTETNLHTFGSAPDASQPRSGVVFGKFGALYGTTLYGGTDKSGGADGAVYVVFP